ncbi:MAG: type II toxin-antitoxin system PemK/MazF family toxin [Alphaproteobacteria bacterium]|nr:type II toxin-antitoxin system PemK/MazF family toxin [Alphaproteobacteria bacterium]
MPIDFHPKIGSILLCDFNSGFKEPEMVKRRPVLVISPAISTRPKLCTVVSISTETPHKVLPFHHLLQVTLPDHWHLGPNWIKGDMIYAVGFHRLDLIRKGKDEFGKRVYYMDTVSDDQLKEIRKCVLSSMGLSALTKHL